MLRLLRHMHGAPFAVPAISKMIQIITVQKRGSVKWKLTAVQVGWKASQPPHMVCHCPMVCFLHFHPHVVSGDREYVIDVSRCNAQSPRSTGCNKFRAEHAHGNTNNVNNAGVLGQASRHHRFAQPDAQFASRPKLVVLAYRCFL